MEQGSANGGANREKRPDRFYIPLNQRKRRVVEKDEDQRWRKLGHNDERREVQGYEGEKKNPFHSPVISYTNNGTPSFIKTLSKRF